MLRQQLLYSHTFEVFYEQFLEGVLYFVTLTPNFRSKPLGGSRRSPSPWGTAISLSAYSIQTLDCPLHAKLVLITHHRYFLRLLQVGAIPKINFFFILFFSQHQHG